jgi:2-[(L-alanin-3-ylcarbamoyl)methyl]-2-hydroxybutanedioate decarboxylase
VNNVIETIRHLSVNSNQPICAYLYDLQALKKHVLKVTEALPANCEMFYAMKANSESNILKAVYPLVSGFEVASLGEIKKARAISPTVPIIFGGPGKTDDEIKGAITHRVQLIHVESIQELQRIAWIAEKLKTTVSILLRVNLTGPFPSATLHMAGVPTQFGIAEDQMDDAIRFALSHPSLKLKGFHFHSVSNQLDADSHLQLIKLYIQKVKQWKKRYNLSISYVNAGGGIGVNYGDLTQQFDWNTFTNRLKELLEKENFQDTKLIFECGRFLTASCGYYAVEVLDIKENHGKTFVVVRGGTQHFRLPVSWQHNHPFEIIPIEKWTYPFPRKGVQQTNITIVGQLCTPKDVFAKDVFIHSIRIGDIILFRYTGAYGWAISHHDFLSHPHPKHIYLDT